MTGNLATLATGYAGRPLLMRPDAALALAERIRAVDSRAFARPTRIGALLSLLGGRDQRPGAMEDAEAGGDWQPVPLDQRLAYCPLYIGEADDTGFCWTLKDGVALMQANTVLTDRGEEYCGEVYHGYDTLLAGMREAAGDDRVRGIFLRSFSPGGVVAGGLEALAAWMRENREAAGGKPIWVYADMAASAAYWVAASADRILSSRVGLVGSIGAVIVHENHAKALEKFGVEITSIEFPLGKTDGAWWKALSDTARADWEAEIRQCGENFFADVQAGRPNLTRDMLEGLGARCFMGQHADPARSALALGLIDEIASEEQAFAQLRAKVSASIPPSQASGTPVAAAKGRRGATSPEKDTPMADKAQTQPGRSAARIAAEQAVVTATADLTRIEAEESAAPAEEPKDAPKDPAPEPEAADVVEPAGDESAAIAASDEAKVEPEMALTAIRSGQTLAQFRANVAAMADRPRGGQLKATLSGSPRLGPDGAPPKDASARLAPKAVYANRAARAAGKKTA